jgi:excisionase family DNA binding protein
MTAPPEITVTGVRYWAERAEQLAQLLKTSRAAAISDPSGQPVRPDEIVVLTCREQWAENPRELHDALAEAVAASSAVVPGSTTAPGAVAPVEDRLVFTVEEAAQLLGISRSFAYEAVQRGDVPSMRIGRRILVPKAALQRFLAQAGDATDS